MACIELTKTVRGLRFEQVAPLADWTNIPQGFDFKDFAEKNGLAGTPFVPVANHSNGGRSWKLRDGVDIDDIPLIPDGVFRNGCGWYCFTEQTIRDLEVTSAGSNSSIAIWEEDGAWAARLHVPYKESPYQGNYWNAFHRFLEEQGLTPEIYLRKTSGWNPQPETLRQVFGTETGPELEVEECHQVLYAWEDNEGWGLLARVPFDEATGTYPQDGLWAQFNELTATTEAS